MSKKKTEKPLKKDCDSLLKWTWRRITSSKNRPKKRAVDPRIVKPEERAALALIIDNEVVETVQSSPRLSAILLSSPTCVELPRESTATIGWSYDSESKTFSPTISE